MNFKPGDFLFGIVDFLAYLVPGMIFLITLPKIIPSISLSFIDISSTGKTEVDNVIFFILLSYIAGHFIHHIGAMILNPAYERFYFKRKSKKHSSFIQGTEINIRQIMPLHLDLLRVADAYIRQQQPSLIPELDKPAANSKMFRGLSLLFIYLCFYPSIPIYHLLLLIFLSIMSFIRFAHQRWRKQLLTYELFSALTYKK